MPDFDPYYEWLGIPPKDQPPHAYRLLGLELFEANVKVIDAAAEQRMLLLKARQGGPHTLESQRLLNEVAQAQRLLLDAAKRAAYDAELRARLTPAPVPQAAAHVAYASATPLPAPPARETPAAAPVTPVGAPVEPVARHAIAPRSRSHRKQALPLPLVLIGVGAAVVLISGVVLFNLPRPVAENPPPANPSRPSPKPEPKPRPDKRIAVEPMPEESSASDPSTAEPPSPMKPEEPLPETPAPAARLPWPDAGERSRALAEIRQSLQADYARDARPEQRAALAQVVARMADDPQVSPAKSAAALVEAHQLAAEGGELLMALALVDRIEREFVYDVRPLLLTTYSQAAAAELPPNKRRRVLSRVLDYAERLIADDDLLSAASLLQQADGPLKAAESGRLVARAEALRARGTLLYREFKGAQPSLQRLVEEPDDPAANTAAGRYYCLARGEWPRGLPLLVLGDDARLRDLAKQDLSLPTSAPQQLSLADGWYAYAESLDVPLALQARLRAAQWYREALTGLSGDDLDRADECVAAMQREGLPALDRPAAERLQTIEEEVYLDDLDEEASFSIDGALGRHGELAHWNPRVTDPHLIFQGKTPKHALFMHPPDNGLGYALYNLGGAFRRLQGACGIVDWPDPGRPAAPLTFRIYGDNRLLWESPPIQERNVPQSYDVDVSYVRQLRLDVEILAGRAYATAAWLQPKLIGARHAVAPLKQRWKRRSNAVYLDDLIETGSIVGAGNVGRFGRVGMPPWHNMQLATDDGQRVTHALATHASRQGTAGAAFELGKRFARFDGYVGISSYPKAQQQTTPLTFHILGDAKELWSSKPIAVANEFQEFDVRVPHVEQLRLEVRCPGVLDNAFSVWYSPRLQFVDKDRPANEHTIRADRVVVTNTRNAFAADRGTDRFNLLLYHGQQLVWQQCGVRLPWEGGRDQQAAVPLPGERFNRLRLEITDTTGNNGAGLNEIQVLRGTENVAPQAAVVASDTYLSAKPVESFAPQNVQDGKVERLSLGQGYWLLPDVSHGWIELEWQSPGRQRPEPNYALKRHPEAAVPYRGHWYAYYPGSITHEEARRRCQQLGGYVVCLESAPERDFVAVLSRHQHIVLGGARDKKGWGWMNGQKVRFAAWMKGQPDNTNGAEPYLEMQASGEWNDTVNDSSNGGYVCEWEE